MRTRVVVLTVLAAVAVAVAVGLAIKLGSRTPLTAQDALAQIAAALKTYAGENDRRYPPVSAEAGAFYPDMTVFQESLTAVPAGDALSAYLTGNCGVQVCYFGHVIPSQTVGLALLDEYDKQGRQSLRDINILFQDEAVQLWAYDDPRLVDALDELGRACAATYRIHEGIQLFISDWGNPRAFWLDPTRFPLVWEMPDNREVPGGWVLYMDGHTEWLPYPGNFPMTGPFIRRIRGSMSAPGVGPRRKPWLVVSTAPPSEERSPDLASPVHDIASRVVDCLAAAWWRLVHCDRTPTVRIDGVAGYRVVLQWDGAPPYYAQDPIELVLFPDHSEVKGALKARIWPDARTEGGRLPVYMGVGHGYHWFGYTTAMLQDNLRERMGLTGGEDRLQLLMDGGEIYLMHRLGEQAIPLLRSIVTGKAENRVLAEAIMALERIPDEKSQEAIRAAFCPGNERAFENAVGIANAIMYAPPRRLKDSTIEIIVQALLRTGNVPELADTAVHLALFTAMGDTREMNRIGREVLRRLPSEVVERTLDELRTIHPSSADMLESVLREGGTG